MTIMSFPASFALGYGSIAKPVITSVPLRIFHLGISVKDIQCKGDLHLIIKSEDGSQACVRPDTAYMLIHRSGIILDDFPWLYKNDICLSQTNVFQITGLSGIDVKYVTVAHRG